MTIDDVGMEMGWKERDGDIAHRLRETWEKGGCIRLVPLTLCFATENRFAAGQPATSLWLSVTRYAEQDQDLALRYLLHRNFNIIMYLKVNDLQCMRWRACRGRYCSCWNWKGEVFGQSLQRAANWNWIWQRRAASILQRSPCLSGPHGRAAMVEPLGASGLVVAAAAWPPWAGRAGERRLKEK
jgi:hypothetical protein